MRTTTKNIPAKRPKYGSVIADELVEGMESLIRDLRRARVTIALPEMPPEAVRSVRESLGLSQPLFAEFIGASASAVKAWERGAKKPTSTARRLLGAIRDDPAYWTAQLAKATDTSR
jgi:putative transcriptional regulator